jgi:predicted dehydrogenase
MTDLLEKGHRGVSRRELLAGGGAATLALGMPPTVARALQAAQDPAAAARATPPTPITLAWVGTGVQGLNDMRQLLRLPGVRIAAVCDVYPPNLQKAIELAGTGCQGYTDYRALLERKEIQGVGIATPLHLHAPVAIHALEAGKHVYCEKMMAYSLEEARKMVRTAARTGRILQVGHQRRYSPDYHHALEMVRKGYFGEITHVRAQWNRNGSWRRAVPEPKYERLLNWRLYREYSHGLMSELGSHQIDVTNWFLGAHPVAVVGMGGIDFYKDGREVYDNVQVVFEYPGGRKLTYQSIQTNAHDDYAEQFMGTRGTLVISEAAGKSMMFREQSAEEFEFAKLSQSRTKVGGRDAILLDAGATTRQDKRARTAGQNLAASGVSKNNWALSLEDWVDCIRTGRQPFCDGAIGLADTACVLAANRAMAEGRRIAITEEMLKV